MENEEDDHANESKSENQDPTEEKSKKPGQLEMSALTEVINHQRVENQDVTTTLHADVKLFVDTVGNQNSERVDLVFFKKGTDYGIVPEFHEEIIRQFVTSRIIVINHVSSLNELVVNAVEKVVFEYGIKHDFRPICCSIHNHQNIHIPNLIMDVPEDKIFNSEEQILIVFEQRPEGWSDAFISLIQEKGPANNITESLKAKKLHLAYVCFNERLFESRAPDRTHFGLYLLDPYIKAFYLINKDYHEAVRYYRIAKDTIRMTGWLSEFSEDQKIEWLIELIRSGSLEKDAQEQMRSIDSQGESRAALQLLADPVKNIIMFVAIYFEGIGIAEFDELVRLMIVNLPLAPDINAQDANLTALLWNWNTNSDTIISECGIYLDVSPDKKVSSYRFLKEIRRKLVSEHLCSRHRLAMMRRHELIELELLEQPLAYSRAYEDGWFKILLETAVIEPHRYLLGLGLKLSDLITQPDKHSYSEEGKKRLLFILSRLIDSWEKDERLKQFITRFYDEMKKTLDRRMLLGKILTFHCMPERHELLQRFKSHLDSISKAELAFNFNLIDQISLNYLEKIPQLLETVMGWKESETDQPLRSASYVRCAYLLLFYLQWPYFCKKNSLSYRIFKQLTAADQGKGLRMLSSFVFGEGITEAFKLLHLDKYRQKYEKEPQLKSTMAAHLYLIHAFVLIQWYYLFKLIRSDDATATWEVNDQFVICAEEITKVCDMPPLKTAIGRACTLLNYEIEENMRKTEKKEVVQLMMLKRDGARELLKLI